MSLKTRVATGLVFGPIMILGTSLNSLACQILYTIISFLCVWEFLGLSIKMNKNQISDVIRQGLGIFIGVFPTLAAFLYTVGGTELGYLAGAYLGLFFLAFFVELYGKAKLPFQNIGMILLASFYIGVPFMGVVGIASTNGGNLIVMGILLSIWASDSFAYFVGSRIGKTKMIPRISPGKTWEGTLGGFVGALVAGVLCWYLFYEQTGLSIAKWVIVAAVCGIFGVFGDLMESMLKRSLGVKDSGTILPGHGGFLDRFDSFIFVILPVLALLFYIF